MSTPSKEGLKKPFLQKSKPVNTGAPARFLSKKMGFFRGYLRKLRASQLLSVRGRENAPTRHF
ncbi:hypothetical protein PLA107_017330 [Pseudomonas amygdali pv. lachrymans str. M301315]|uniref:Uncharacterized protein n=1 Tax=Pseudomonas amygdali pv. lachrymans str. M301315 TaxID=629260 RepID=A0AAD0M0E6_PSEAV|nr:hypothetical protein B5U27_08715 [Pseudomonas amygdali pv. lachrymans]AXH56866.1 hypothetical protein PLA107_017330 [Pseudomonas amygdali pv. lachrymans str. M301315]PWD03327.1 hypothetical protein CX658_13520 [Pseudomonas amygdali pv. lachrymans]